MSSTLTADSRVLKLEQLVTKLERQKEHHHQNHLRNSVTAIEPGSPSTTPPPPLLEQSQYEDVVRASTDSGEVFQEQVTTVKAEEQVEEDAVDSDAPLNLAFPDWKDDDWLMPSATSESELPIEVWLRNLPIAVETRRCLINRLNELVLMNRLVASATPSSRRSPASVNALSPDSGSGEQSPVVAAAKSIVPHSIPESLHVPELASDSNRTSTVADVVSIAPPEPQPVPATQEPQQKLPTATVPELSSPGVEDPPVPPRRRLPTPPRFSMVPKPASASSTPRLTTRPTAGEAPSNDLSRTYSKEELEVLKVSSFSAATDINDNPVTDAHPATTDSSVLQASTQLQPPSMLRSRFGHSMSSLPKPANAPAKTPTPTATADDSSTTSEPAVPLRANRVSKMPTANPLRTSGVFALAREQEAILKRQVISSTGSLSPSASIDMTVQRQPANPVVAQPQIRVPSAGVSRLAPPRGVLRTGVGVGIGGSRVPPPPATGGK